MESWVDWLLSVAALPKVGLPAVFLICFISATLLPLGSEPAVFAYIKLNPNFYWLTIFVATLGNTLGGMLNWVMGYGAKIAFLRLRAQKHTVAAAESVYVEKNQKEMRLEGCFGQSILIKIKRYGALSLLFSWLPIVGDPLCGLAGWLRFPWHLCLIYMAIGKALRYIVITSLLLFIPDSIWYRLLDTIGM